MHRCILIILRNDIIIYVSHLTEIKCYKNVEFNVTLIQFRDS